MAKTKQVKSGPPPSGSLPSVLSIGGVNYVCVSANLESDIFIFKGSDGSRKVKTWNDLHEYRIK